MDNFNGFPATYQSPYQPTWQYYPQVSTTPAYVPTRQTTTVLPSYQQNQQMLNNSNIIWIQGEEAAKAQNVPNGCNMAFFDSENQCIYIKSVDASGKPSLTILDYVDRNAPTEKEESKIEYATKEQIDSQFSSINKRLDILNSYVTKDQFDSLNNHINDLANQVEDIENRLTGFGKSQQNNSNNRRGNK